MTKEAMKQALEALKDERDKYLEYSTEDGAPEYIYEAIRALEFEVAKQAFVEPVQEPIGTAGELFTNAALERLDFRPSTKIYTTPQPQPAPVQKNRPACHDGDDKCPNRQACCDAGECMYYTPQPQREWVGLTDKEAKTVWAFEWKGDRAAFIHAIEAKLKEKNAP
jgi:hypothetical protein